MADVGALAGVSHMTVSRVLNGSATVLDETRLRVLEAIEVLGYRHNQIARVLATNRSGRIGMVSVNLDLYGPSRTAHAVQQAALAASFEVTLMSVGQVTPGVVTRAVEGLLGQAAEALVIAVSQADAIEEVRRLNLPVPHVFIEGVPGIDPCSVGVDQTLGARLATEHLLDLGHSTVAHVSGPLGWREAEARRRGWADALIARGLTAGPEVAGDWSPSSGYDAGRALAARPDVTAVFAGNDAMALGVTQALLEQSRRVPDDVSVVGFDDVPESAYYWPPLTTVRQDFAAVGLAAVGMALRALESEACESVLVPPTLVTRQSSARRSSKS